MLGDGCVGREVVLKSRAGLGSVGGNCGPEISPAGGAEQTQLASKPHPQWLAGSPSDREPRLLHAGRRRFYHRSRVHRSTSSTTCPRFNSGTINAFTFLANARICSSGKGQTVSRRHDAVPLGIARATTARHRGEVAENSVVTVNGDLRTLRRILHLAVEWGRLPNAPAIHELPQSKGRERVVSFEEDTAEPFSGDVCATEFVYFVSSKEEETRECI